MLFFYFLCRVMVITLNYDFLLVVSVFISRADSVNKHVSRSQVCVGVTFNLTSPQLSDRSVFDILKCSLFSHTRKFNMVWRKFLSVLDLFVGTNLNFHYNFHTYLIRQLELIPAIDFRSAKSAHVQELEVLFRENIEKN